LQEYIALFHACLRNATTTAQISPYSTPFELQHALTVAQPTRLFIDAKLLDRMLPVCKEAGIADDNIYILKSLQNKEEVNGRKSCLSIIHHVKKESLKTVAVGIAAKDTVAYLVFSSGTTGLPKGILHSIEQFLVFDQLSSH
jgi:acyl-CoA synthetase (AMP-forming)/AMP-acid ligase II